MKTSTTWRTAACAAALLSAAPLFHACSDVQSGGPLPVPAADEWTSLGQNLASTYFNAAEKKLSVANIGDLEEQWKLEAKGPITGAPVVRDGVIYVLSGGGTYAIAADDGRVIWLNENVRGTSSVTWFEGRLFVNDARSFLHALDASTGTEIWESQIDPHPTASGFSSPTVFERYVIVGSASVEEAGVANGATFRGSVVAFDRETGEEIWRFYTVEPPYNGAAVWSSITIDPVERLAFASTGNNYTEEASDTSDALFALDVDTGKLAWLTQLSEGDVFTILNPQSPDTDFGTNPVLIDTKIGGQDRKILVAAQKSGVVWGLDRLNGEILWSHAVSAGSALIGGMLNNGAFDGTHFLTAGTNCRNAAGQLVSGVCSTATTRATLVAMDPATGAYAWERELASWVWAPITVANGVGFVAVDTTLQAFDTATGRELFSFPTDGTIASAPTVAEGRVHFGAGLSYFVGKPGRMLHVLSLEGGGGGGGGGGTTGAPTFTAIWNEIFVPTGCNTGSCHGGGAGGLSMASKDEAWRDLVNVVSDGPACASTGLVRVVPGDPDASLLVDKIAVRPPVCGSAMPFAGPLDSKQVEQVREWIRRGAAND
ncbi:MAG: PQQ-binding-like beta-propeller repeat protein [Alphaproteobacteria bacterium]